MVNISINNNKHEQKANIPEEKKNKQTKKIIDVNANYMLMLILISIYIPIIGFSLHLS